ncbi:MAG TPA: DNA repair exonuclease, partial [Bacilli bacterium]|nr:DNA repair exonuclease [Bacilli bacterium]
MKIIHCADLHLGSRLTSLPAGEIRDARKNDILASFDGLINYANDNGVQIIMFSGDVFDSDRPTKKDKAYFYSAIQSNPNIAFLYLKGNHDTEESLVENYDNLHTFSEKWASYKFEDAVISGIELSSSNKTSLYSSLNLKKEDVNIVMMHGDINTKGKEHIDLSKLANKNIDYLALGHIHSHSQTKIDSRGIAVYSGCLDG